MDEDNGYSDYKKIEQVRNKYGIPAHYHGQIVRKLFVAVGIIMIVTLPFLNHRLPTPPFISILFIVIMVSVAGFITPRTKPIFFIDFIISTFGVLVFEYYAIQAYAAYSASDLLFLVDQTIAIILLFAVYYAAKTLRAAFLGK